MRDIIEGTIAAVMKKNGFRRKSNSWYLRTDDTILVVNLQRSQWGRSHSYINLAVWLNALGENTFPKQYNCHILFRIESFDAPSRNNYWYQTVLNLENTDMSDAERIQKIQSFLEEKALPFLLSCGSVEGIRKLYREERFKDLWGVSILPAVKKLLEESE